MESTIDNIIQTNTKKPLLPQLFARTGRESFEQVCQRMQGLAELAATWRSLMEIYGNWTGRSDNEGLGEYIMALDKQFARAFFKAFPSVEFMQDALVQGGLDAILEAEHDAESAG